MNFKLFISLIILITFNNVFGQELIIFGNIPGRNPSTKYSCRVRQVCSNEWDTSFVLQTTSKPEIDSNGQNMNGYVSHLEDWSASWIAFEFSGTAVEVEISKVDGSPIIKAMVRPMGEAKPAQIINGKAYVTFTNPANVNVDIDGQLEETYTGMGYNGPAVHTISIFANPVFKKPNLSSSNVYYLTTTDHISNVPNTVDSVYFAPGQHHIGIPYQISSYKTLYIPGDAVIHGTIRPPNTWGSGHAHHWSVYGSGTLSGEEIPHHHVPNMDSITDFNKPFSYQASSVRLEGFVVADPAHHVFIMNNVTMDTTRVNIFKNLKILAWRLNSDGVSAFRNSTITDCFFRCQDDNYSYGGNYVKIKNCTAWNDFNGSALYVKYGGSVPGSSCFNDIKVIYNRASWHYWGGGRVISFRDASVNQSFENIEIKNVLVEDPFPAFPPFYFTIGNTSPSDPPIIYNNVLIENVTQLNPGTPNSWGDPLFGAPRNTILGDNSTQQISNVTFKNCNYAGNWLESLSDGDFNSNSFIQNIQFLLTDTIPFNLDTFYVEQNDCFANLSWTASNEVNTNFYSIEKSNDGQMFNEIGQVPSLGYSPSQNNYTFTDSNLGQNSCFYRLKKVDTSGNIKYCPFLYLCVETTDTLSLQITTCDSLTINNTSYFNSGNYILTLQNVNGCDSIVNLNMTISHSSDSTLTIQALDSITINNQLYTSSGNYEQHLINFNGCDSTIYVQIEMDHTGLESINSIEIKVYPNPTSSFVTIEFPNIGKTKIEVHDITNRICEPVKYVSNNNQIQLDLTYLSAGVYFISAPDLNESVIKIIKSAPK